MKELKNKTETLYDNNYFEVEEKYVNSDEIYNEDDYYNFDKLQLLDKVIVKDKKKITETKEENELVILEELDVEKYKLDFIDKFISIFPDIYTKDELKKILDKNLNKILKVKETTSKQPGEYCYPLKLINVKKEIDRVLFHEFIHALRGDESIEEVQIVDGIFEGFTRWCENVYLFKKNVNNDYNYKHGEHKYLFQKNKDVFKRNLVSYDILANLMQEFSFLYSMINDEESLLEMYLENKNIYSKIYEIYNTYYNKIAEIEKIDKENYDIELDSMRYTYYIIGMINEIYELIINENKRPETNYEILKIVEVLEEELTKIYEVLNIGKEKVDYRVFNELLLTNSVMSNEERLLKVIFGEAKIINCSFEEEMDNIHNTFVKRR